ncbi:MAG: DUF5054 domain-containing protein [Clostridia bacterium]|nr:DUF5054 domain-containing protein [Clostridia bacterium]
MKKVIVVSKTHLDLGFTDYAENIRMQYINRFIPEAINLANQVNSENEKSFIWTTGSWILKEALLYSEPSGKEKLTKALQEGNIVPHAMPFTLHSELLDYDTFDYGLSIVDEIDKLTGRKTVAAKMTDVPGHTKGIIKPLAEHGIKLLHLGVNGASALPEVPECFLWKDGKYEIVVIYSGAYGGAFRSDLVDEILYFDHTLDNHGAPSPEKVKEKINSIRNEYPGYEVTAGTLDEYAEVIWEKRDRLPVLECEIGDTWIHGSATDPYKSGCLRELMRLKRQWIKNDSMVKGSAEYIAFSDALLCIAEHTCGMDSKIYFSDYEHYLKKDFQKARKADKVKIRHPFRDFPQSILPVVGRLDGRRKRGYYSVIEKSWREQRAYIDLALSVLSDEHKAEAQNAISSLIPLSALKLKNGNNTQKEISCGKWVFRLNEKGGVGYLAHGGDVVIKENEKAAVDYFSFTNDDYNYWLTHYTRDLKETAKWSIGDFARPALKHTDGKFPSGRFEYWLDCFDFSAEENSIIANLKCDKKLCEELGAPELIQIIYSLSEKGLRIDLSWYKKDANRITEAIYFHLFPCADELKYRKLDTLIDPTDIASMGGRNLNVVQSIQVKLSENRYTIENLHSPIVSAGKGKILHFDNKYEDIEKDGLTYVLYNNVWGTNFPLWYEENAHFGFCIGCSDN